MILKQYYLGCLAHASYLIADDETKVGVLVDPKRDIDEYVTDAQSMGVELKHVFLTHFHADFVAGHLELRDRLGAQIHLGGKAKASFDFVAHADGDQIDFGKVRFKILETPGHTPEGISILVFDLEKSTEIPHAVLTGDTLFIGDVGRPDLLASVGVTQEELASSLYDSLHEKLLALPDETLVYPAHGAGSLCGKSLSSDTVSTIGDQRRYNYALQPMSKEEFMALVTAEQPEAPAYFVYDATMNKEERATLDESKGASLKGLNLETFLRHQNEGAQVLDVREAVEFAGAHLAGSVNIGLSGKFATWAGSLLDPKQPIVLLADPGREEEAVVRLGRIGFDNVVGYLDGGMAALETRPDLIARVERITGQALAEKLQSDDAPVVVDVRGPGEWNGCHVEGSVNIPLPHVIDRLDELPTDRPVAVICRSGYRSCAATSLMQQHGRTNLLDVVGGMEAWKAAQLPVVESAAEPAGA